RPAGRASWLGCSCSHRRSSRSRSADGPLLALVFLGYPMQTALVVNPTPERVLLALAGAALFGGGFVWLLWTRRPLLSAPAETAEVMQRRAAVMCLVALVVALNAGLARGPTAWPLRSMARR